MGVAGFPVVRKPAGRVDRMNLLTIDLQDGFKDDLVTVKVNGKEVLGGGRISTEFQIGWAKRLEVEVEENHAVVDISISTKKQSKEIKIELSGHTYLGLSLTPTNDIDVRISSEPFGYL